MKVDELREQAENQKEAWTNRLAELQQAIAQAQEQVIRWDERLVVLDLLSASPDDTEHID